VLGAKGLSGGLRAEVLTDFPERLEPGATVWIEGEPSARTIRDAERGGRSTVLYLEGVDDRAGAEALLGRYLEVEASEPPPGSYWWHQLVGLEVSDLSGVRLGTLAEVFRAGENEVYRVEGPGGETLIPATRDAVRAIDLEAGRMLVDYHPEEVR
jgi:16S rRNA processing protein RimM